MGRLSGIWCNGSTHPSGGCSPSSNLGIPKEDINNMGKSLHRIREIRRIEKAVNTNLFFISAFTTLILMVVIAVEFFSRGNFPPSQMNLFYVGVLMIYSLHKEMLRWMGEKEKERKGEWFLYSWIIFTVILSCINFLSKGYFSHSPDGQPLSTLTELYTTTLEVGAVFIIMRLSKAIRFYFEGK